MLEPVAERNGTHHGVGRPHLQAYLDEFVFRHNRRGNLEAAFQTLLGLGSKHAPVRTKTILGAQDFVGVPLKQTVQETNFGPHDWLVVMTYGGYGPQPEHEAELKSQGWTEKHFVDILLFRHGAACPERIRAPVPTRR